VLKLGNHHSGFPERLGRDTYRHALVEVVAAKLAIVDVWAVVVAVAECGEEEAHESEEDEDDLHDVWYRTEVVQV
jgi:hypothetical protein